MKKRKTKKVFSVLLSAIIALSSLSVCDFSAFAKTTVETITANFDFSQSFSNGNPIINNNVGSGNVSFFQYRGTSGYTSYTGSSIYHDRNNGTYSAYVTSPMAGCFEEDGFVFIDNLINYISDDKDFEISWKYYVYNKAFSDSYAGYFSIGTGFQTANKGAARYTLDENAVLSTSYDGKIRKADSIYPSVTFSAATSGEKECSIYYSAESKTFTIKIGNETKTVTTTYLPSQMNYFAVGSSTRSSYGKFILDHITVKTIEQKADINEATAMFKNAMASYESKMSSGTIYTNMSVAYNAYVNCQKAYDAYVYGGNTNLNINSYINTLNTAVADLTPWQTPVANVIPSFSSSDSCNSANARNCLWSEINDDPVSCIVTRNNTTTNFYYHDSVYMYTNESPLIPYLLGFYRNDNSAFANPKNPRVWYMNLTAQTGGLYTVGSSYNGNTISGERDFRSIVTQSYHINSTATANSNNIILSTSDLRYMANYFSVNYSSAFNNNSVYYVVAKPINFVIGCGYKDSESVTATYDLDTSGGKTFYLINYKALLDYINSATYKEYFKNISNYSEGGLEKLMAAYDIATKVDPTSYNYSSNTLTNVQGCASAIQSAVTQFKNVGTITADSSAYTSLRNSIESARAFGDTNIQISNGATKTTRYTVSSWNAYISALTTAKAAMTNVLSSSGYAASYNSTSISNIANNISNGINELKYNYIVEYINYAGESMGTTVCEENSNISTNIVMNTATKPGTQENHTHTVYEWPNTTLTRAVYGNSETVRINENAKEAACTLTEREVITEATCTTPEVKLFACMQCSAEYEITGEMLVHEYTVTVVPPTCTQQGYTRHICERCSDSYDDNFTDIIEHSYVSTIVEPTCDSQGYTAKRCSVCGYEIIDESSYVDALGHEYTYELVNQANCIFTGIGEYTCTICDHSYIVEIPTDSSVHSDMLFARTVSPTDVEMGYDIYYCSNLCGYWEKRNLTPAIGSDNDFASYIEAYNAASASVVTDFEPYTAESISAYNEAIQNTEAAGNQAIENKSISDIENATKDIIEASTLLRIKTCSVKIYICTSNGEIREFNCSADNVDYGEAVSIDIANELNNENVEKWTVEKNGITKKVAYSDTSYDMVATDDTIVNVYLTNEETEPSDSSKITMLNNDGRVISTAYVKNGYVINLSDETLLGITAPSVPFYQFIGWKVVSGNSTVNSDTVIQAAYTVI